MSKSVEEKLEAATLLICDLKAQIAELEDIIQAHKTVSKWRETSPLSKGVAEQLTHLINSKGTHTGRFVGKAPELASPYGLCGYRVDVLIVDDLWVESTAGNAMAEAHRIFANHAMFDKVMSNRIAPNEATEFNYHSLEARTASTMGVPSEFIGIDTADGPGTAVEVEARIEAGNKILHSVAEYPARAPKDDLTAYLIGRDPNCTLEKWRGNGLTIFKLFDDDLEAGLVLFDKWSSGELGSFKTPPAYTYQRTETQWGKFTTDKEK